MILRFPNNFTANDFHSVWTNALKIAKNKSHEMVIDASQLEYFDVEGANYLALIPCFLRKRFKPVTIILPELDKTYSYMGTIGLIDFLSKYFNLSRANQRSFTLSNKVNTSVVYKKRIADLYKNNILLKRLDDLSHKLSAKVCLSLIELVNNIFDHSQQTLGCVSFHFYQDHPKKGGMDRFMFAVSDLGIGIKKSFLNSSNHSINPSAPDVRFIEYAIKNGTTSTSIQGRGNGLPIAISQANKIHISSGNGTIYLGNSTKHDKVDSRKSIYLQGTSVRLIFDLEEDDEIPIETQEKQFYRRIIRNGQEIKRVKNNGLGKIA